MTVDLLGLEQLLGTLDVTDVRAARHQVAGDRPLVLTSGSPTLGYIVSGTASLGAPGRIGCADAARPDGAEPASYTAQAGDALLVAPSAPATLTGTAEIVTVDIDLRDLSPLDTLPPVVWLTGFSETEPSVATLAASFGPPPADPRGGVVVCRLMAATVLASVIRAWAVRGCAPRGWPSPGIDPFLARAAAAVNAEPGNLWTLEQLSQIGAMSRSVFAERFRDAFGVPPGAFVTTARMERAKQLLSAGDPVSRTARELGYDSDEGFSRAFRRHTGVVPSRWRATAPAAATT